MPYKIVYRGGEGEIEEKKSRFLAHVQPVSAEEDALRFLAKIKKEYWDARHNCYAYTIGKNHELQRYSDDGEPGGTAGRPMLDVLLHEDIHNTIVVVTRYFGGTLLGTGGLVRAYQRSTQEGLSQSVIAEIQSGIPLTIGTDYTDVGKLQYLTAQKQIPVTDARYTDAVELDVIVPTKSFDAFCKEVTGQTAGRAMLQKKDPVDFAWIDGKAVLFS